MPERAGDDATREDANVAVEDLGKSSDSEPWVPCFKVVVHGPDNQRCSRCAGLGHIYGTVTSHALRCKACDGTGWR